MQDLDTDPALEALRGAPRQLLATGQVLAARARAAGIPVSPEQIGTFLTGLDLLAVTDRAGLRRLATITLAGGTGDLAVLHALVDVTFLPQAGDREHGPAVTAAAGAGESLRDGLFAALREGGAPSALRLGAEAAAMVTVPGGGLPGSVRYAQQRALRSLDLADLLRRAMAEGVSSDGLERGLSRAERDETMRAFEKGLLDELRLRAARDRLSAADAVEADGSVDPLAELAPNPLDLDLAAMSRQEAARLADVVRPLAGMLAARIRRRRRARRGHLDLRRTLRAALATGGVPLSPVTRRRRPSQPKVMVLCDVSGSMAEHARFLLALLTALHQELPRVRTFAFVDGIAEVTGLLAGRRDVVDARVLLSAPGVVGDDGHSAYGDVLTAFADRYGPDLGPDTTIVVLGDARVRGLDPRVDVLAELSRRVRRICWLNPEPVSDWDTGDSRLAEYRPYCAHVAEVRTLRQLADWIHTLA